MSHFLNYPQHILGTFIYDIETVPLTETFEELEELNPLLAETWFNEADKIRHYRTALESDKFTDQELYEEYGGLYPEFGKVVSVSGGVFNKGEEEEEDLEFFMTNITNESEVHLLVELADLFDRIGKRKINFVLGGYNIKIFDNPFLLKRYVINGMEIPSKLNHIDKKPWEIADIDLAERWKISSYDKFVKLDTLAGVFNVKSSKEKMDGSQVKKVYYSEQENRLEQIEEYCDADTIVTAKLFYKMAGLTGKFDIQKFYV